MDSGADAKVSEGGTQIVPAPGTDDVLMIHMARARADVGALERRRLLQYHVIAPC